MVVGDVTTGTDVLVIGGGPGGYVAAIRAAQLDRDVTLVEDSHYGGTCVNHGCIPSKAFLSTTELAHSAGDAERRGVYADPAIDMQGMVRWKDSVVRRLRKGIESLCERAGVNKIDGRAEFVEQGTARVVKDGEGQGAETIAFDHAIVATGSRPVALPGFEFDGERVLSSRDALALESAPDSLVVIGAGYIGMELATVYQKVGTDVTIVEQFDEILPGFEDDLSDVVRARADDLGVTFHLGQTADEWEEHDDHLTVTTAADDGESTSIDAEKLLVAVGREPVTETANLAAIDIETDERGFVETDDRCRTSVENVYAVGDVAGEPMLAHKAFREGEVAAEVIAGEPAALDYQAMPAAVFTDPEIATVGMTEAEAEQAGFDPVTGQMYMRASGRALTLDEKAGFVRIVADATDGFILGGQIVGPAAAEIIAELALAVEMGATLEDVASTIHVHPTLAEAVHETAMGAAGHSIHY